MRVLLPLCALICASLADKLVKHDSTFVPDIVLVATQQEVEFNCTTRLSTVFNGTSPGPTLRLTEGKTSWIRVYNNQQDNNLTVHWHGLTQRTAPFSDGTPLVAQWPIPPGNFFDYEVRPQKGDAGTYFYHSHVGFQQVSAHGALIVKDAAAPPYKYDQERVLTVGTFFPPTDSEVEEDLTGAQIKWPGEATSILVNGKSGNVSFSGKQSSCTPHIIEIEPGKKFRLRVISASALPLVKMVIQGHRNLTVIEADGQYTKTANTDHIQVGPGQRFSYLLKAKSADQIKKLGMTEFWIYYESRDRPSITSGYALLRYKMPGKKLSPPTLSLPDVPPVLVPNKTYNYLESTLQSYSDTHRKNFPKLSEVTRTVYLSMHMLMANGGNFYVNADGAIEPNGTLDWAANNFAWQEQRQAAQNRVPYLINVLKNKRAPNHTLALQNGGFDPSSKTYPARVGEVLDIVWQGNAGIAQYFDSHPMHMHGEHVYDLGSGNGSYDARANEKKFASGAFTPAKRDTTMLYRYVDGGSSAANVTMGWRAWRIRVTERNVGAWMAHCHIAQHAIQGMNTIWVFGGVKQIRSKFPSTPYVSGYLDYGGSAYGSEKKAPVVNHHFEGREED